MVKVVAHRVQVDGDVFDLTYDTDDIAGFEAPIDVIDTTQPGDTAHRRELGQAHLVLHFRDGARPLWVKAEQNERR